MSVRQSSARFRRQAHPGGHHNRRKRRIPRKTVAGVTVNRSALRLLFAVTVVAATAYVYVTSASLPDPLASHFAFDGHANNRMSRAAYQVMMTAMTLLIPLVIVVLQI